MVEERRRSTARHSENRAKERPEDWQWVGSKRPWRWRWWCILPHHHGTIKMRPCWLWTRFEGSFPLWVSDLESLEEFSDERSLKTGAFWETLGWRIRGLGFFDFIIFLMWLRVLFVAFSCQFKHLIVQIGRFQRGNNSLLFFSLIFLVGFSFGYFFFFG